MKNHRTICCVGIISFIIGNHYCLCGSITSTDATLENNETLTTSYDGPDDLPEELSNGIQETLHTKQIATYCKIVWGKLPICCLSCWIIVFCDVHNHEIGRYLFDIRNNKIYVPLGYLSGTWYSFNLETTRACIDESFPLDLSQLKYCLRMLKKPSPCIIL